MVSQSHMEGIMDITSATKKCTSCPEGQNIHPVTSFSRSTQHKTGYKSQCKSCISQSRRRWLAEGDNREKEQERLRKWGCDHLEQERQRLREYKRANRELMRQKKRLYYATNQDTILKKQREHRRENIAEIRAYSRQWARAHPEVGRMSIARRRARQAGLPHTLTTNDVRFCYQYWHYACAICGRSEGLFGEKLVLDHWIPIADPACPGNVADNMIPLCNGKDTCNTSKNACEPIAWLTRRYGPHKARNILRKIEAYFAVVRAREH